MSVYDDYFNNMEIDPKWTKDKDPLFYDVIQIWEIGSNVLWIHKPFCHQAYAHIEQEVPFDLLTMIAKVRMRNVVGSTNKLGFGIAFYWDIDNHCRIIIQWSQSDPEKRHFRAHWDIASTEDTLRSNQAITIDDWFLAKIQITLTQVLFSTSADGETWDLFKTLTRPTQWNGAPALCILGQGHSDNPSYPNPDFDNSKGGSNSVIYEADYITFTSPLFPKIVRGIAKSTHAIGVAESTHAKLVAKSLGVKGIAKSIHTKKVVKSTFSRGKAKAMQPYEV